MQVIPEGRTSETHQLTSCGFSEQLLLSLLMPKGRPCSVLRQAGVSSQQSTSMEGAVVAPPANCQRRNSRLPRSPGPYLSVLVVDHNIVRFDISVHDPHTMAIIQGLEKNTTSDTHKRIREESLRLQDQIKAMHTARNYSFSV